MPHLVAVTACGPFTYEGRQIQAGEVFTVDPVQATILHRAGAVRLEGTLPDQVPAPPRVKRRYRRRDLRAESD